MERADSELGFLLKYENVAWFDSGKVRILDRRIYPVKTEYVICDDYLQVARAISDMVTQSGGPYAAAAMGMVLAAYYHRNESAENLIEVLQNASFALSHARPTTVEKMSEITESMLRLACKSSQKGVGGDELVEILRREAINYYESKYSRYEKAAKHFSKLIPDNATIMTQCFAETIIGTLLRELRREDKKVSFICTETRPYFQGSRLTASLIYDMGFDVTVISDNMPAHIMKVKNVDIFTSAADVITMDGHIINKIGTLQMALAAQYNGIPYFVTGSPNVKHLTAESVNIEERNPDSVREYMGIRIVKDGVKAYYPAFDVVPPKLVNGVITDQGVFSPYCLSSYVK